MIDQHGQRVLLAGRRRRCSRLPPERHAYRRTRNTGRPAAGQGLSPTGNRSAQPAPAGPRPRPPQSAPLKGRPQPTPAAWSAPRESRAFQAARSARQRGRITHPRPALLQGQTTHLLLVAQSGRTVASGSDRKGPAPVVPQRNELITAIEDYLKATNDNPKSFVWTATANKSSPKSPRDESHFSKRRILYETLR